MDEKPLRRIRWRQRWYRVFCGCDEPIRGERKQYDIDSNQFLKSQQIQPNTYAPGYRLQALKIIALECKNCHWYHYISPDIKADDPIYLTGTISPASLSKIENIESLYYFGFRHNCAPDRHRE